MTLAFAMVAWLSLVTMRRLAVGAPAVSVLHIGNPTLQGLTWGP